MKAWIAILAMGLCSVLADDICTEIKKASPKSIQMVNAQMYESEFVVDIEAVLKEVNVVQNMRMYYSKRKNIIRLDILDANVKTQLYFYFENNEILDFNRASSMGRGACSVYSDISSVMDDSWFGGFQKGSKKPSIPAPLAALHFVGLSGFSNNKIKHNYLGRTDVRGKTSTIYTSCQKWTAKNDDIVLNVTHYFANENFKFPYTKNKYSTLLQMEVTGTGKVKGQADTTIDHVYNYFNFRGFEQDDTSLETPEGIVCKGRKPDNKHKFPKLPNYIKFSGEVISKSRKKFEAKEEVYDYRNQFAIVKSIDKLNSKADMNKNTMVYDFSINKLYVVDEVETSCQYHNISEFAKSLDLYTLKNGVAVMDGPQSFFMAKTEDFTYLGQKKLRGMMTEVWVAPLIARKGAVVQYHFAPDVSSWNNDIPSNNLNKWPVPVKVKTWTDQYDKQPDIENVFHVDYNPITTDYIDMSPCFPYTYHMQIVVTGMRSDIINSFQELFFSETKRVLGETGRVSIHQINQMKIDYNGNNIYLEFLIGSRDNAAAIEATQTITKDLTSKKLVLKARDPTTKKWSKSLPLVSVTNLDVAAAKAKMAASSTDSSDSGYTKGAMAGIGIAMVLVGMAGGAGAGFLHGKHFG